MEVLYKENIALFYKLLYANLAQLLFLFTVYNICDIGIIWQEMEKKISDATI